MGKVAERQIFIQKHYIVHLSLDLYSNHKKVSYLDHHLPKQERLLFHFR